MKWLVRSSGAAIMEITLLKQTVTRKREKNSVDFEIKCL